MDKPYFHLRSDGFQAPSIDLQTLCKVFAELLRGYQDKGYLQKAFGYECVDAGTVGGEKGASLASYLLTDAMIVTHDPVWEHLHALDGRQVLGMHEAVFQVVAKPLPKAGDYHSYSNCGWHIEHFDVTAGQKE